jgi:ADP-ribose pyrophosphatase
MDERKVRPDGPDIEGHRGKPNGPAAGWQLRRSEVLFEDQFQRLRRDGVAVGKEGQTKEIEFTYQERPAGVLIVPVTPEGNVLFVRQYRYAVDDWGLEVPAGGTQDTGGLPLEEVARKELREEVGATAEEVRAVGWFYATGALTDEVCHVFLATGVRREQSPEREVTEQAMEVRTVPADEALRLARSGGIRIGPSALALLLCEPHLTATGVAGNSQT